MISVATRASLTATANTCDLLILLQLRARHTADTCTIEVGFFRLNAAKATQLEPLQLAIAYFGKEFISREGNGSPSRTLASSTLQ